MRVLYASKDVITPQAFEIPGCAIDNCGEPILIKSRQMCVRHYSMWWRTGDAHIIEKIAPIDRYDEVLGAPTLSGAVVGPCWIFRGFLDADGYSHLRTGGKVFLAHRYFYQTLVAPIPAGLTLDHLCRVRNCVNPRHLEPVTQAENTRRAAKHAPTRSACASGHIYTDETTYTTSSGKRHCRLCRLNYKRAWRQKKREQANARALS